MNRKETTRLNVEVPTELYANLMAYCRLHKIYIKDVVISHLEALPQIIIPEKERKG